MMMKKHVEIGSWKLQVVNSVGIAIRRQPFDSDEMKTDAILEKDRLVTCDRMVESDTGVRFYRLKDTANDWVFDFREDYPMMKVLQTSNGCYHRDVNFASPTCWSPDFVRGLAVSIEGMTEIAYTPASRVISFQTSEGARINVYYTTQTVGTAIDHPSQGKTQLFRRNCSTSELLDIFRNPRTHTRKGYKRKRDSPDHVVLTDYGSGILLEEEEERRNALLECDEEIRKLQTKRNELLKCIRTTDLQRAEEAALLQEQADMRYSELEEAARKEREARVLKQRQAREAELKQQRRAREAELKEQRLIREVQRRTCNICDRVFSNVHAKDQHYEAVHMYKCAVCWRVFNDYNAMSQHCTALGHW
jgi:hypothetical protein